MFAADLAALTHSTINAQGIVWVDLEDPYCAGRDVATLAAVGDEGYRSPRPSMGEALWRAERGGVCAGFVVGPEGRVGAFAPVLRRWVAGLREDLALRLLRAEGFRVERVASAKPTR